MPGGVQTEDFCAAAVAGVDVLLVVLAEVPVFPAGVLGGALACCGCVLAGCSEAVVSHAAG